MLRSGLVFLLFTYISAQRNNFYEEEVRNAPEEGAPGDHKVTIEDSVSDDQKEYIMKMLEEKTSAEMGRDFDELIRMSFWYAILNRPAGYEFVHDVSLEASREFFSSNITGHGCYCWPDGQDRISGFGPRKDQLDEVCFNLWNCYRCVNMQEGCGTTDWVTAAYGCAFADENADGYLELKCTDSPGSCGKLLCECDLAFASNVKHAVMHKHKEHDGIFPDGCPRQNGFTTHAANEKECCGTWPQVRPYPFQSHCCGNDQKVYKQDTKGANSHCVDDDGEFTDNPMTEEDVAAIHEGHTDFHEDNPDIDEHEHDLFHDDMDRALSGN